MYSIQVTTNRGKNLILPISVILRLLITTIFQEVCSYNENRDCLIIYQYLITRKLRKILHLALCKLLYGKYVFLRTVVYLKKGVLYSNFRSPGLHQCQSLPRSQFDHFKNKSLCKTCLPEFEHYSLVKFIPQSAYSQSLNRQALPKLTFLLQ